MNKYNEGFSFMGHLPDDDIDVPISKSPSPAPDDTPADGICARCGRDHELDAVVNEHISELLENEPADDTPTTDPYTGQDMRFGSLERRYVLSQVQLDSLLTKAVQSERQRIADSLPEKLRLYRLKLAALMDEVHSPEEAEQVQKACDDEAVREVLILPTGGEEQHE